MVGTGTPEDSEDPSVVLVEAILDRIASRTYLDGSGLRPVADNTLLLCACCGDGDDAPTWLIYDDPDGLLHWCLDPDASEAADVVDARSSAAGHVAPRAVLAWLRGDRADPRMGGDSWGDEEVVRQLGHKILSR